MNELAAERSELVKSLYQEHGKAPVNFGAHLRGAAYGRAGQTYYDSLLVIDQSRLVTGLGAAVVLGIVLAVKGREVLFSSGSIAQFLAYVMALHYFSSGCRNIAGSFTALNRFYPVISRHAQLLQAETPSTTARTVESMSIAVRDHSSETDQRLIWRAGQRVGLLLPCAASREQLLPLMNLVHVPGGVARIGFVDYRLVELHGDVLPAQHSSTAPAQVVVASAMAEVEAPAAVVIHCGPLASFSAGSLARLDTLLFIRADGRLTRLDAEWAERNRKEVKLLLAEAKAAATQAQAAKGGAALGLDEDLL